MRSSKAGVTDKYHTPSGYTTRTGPDAHTPRHGVSPRLTRVGPNSSPSRCSSSASSEYIARPRRSGEQQLPVHTSTWREYGSRMGSGVDPRVTGKAIRGKLDAPLL